MGLMKAAGRVVDEGVLVEAVGVDIVCEVGRGRGGGCEVC